jgi:hypothetical protein
MKSMDQNVWPKISKIQEILLHTSSTFTMYGLLKCHQNKPIGACEPDAVGSPI